MNVEDTKKLIEEIKARHEALSGQSQEVADPADIIPDVEAFIQEIRRAGNDIPTGSSRDLLVSLASFWATYVFQGSPEGRYPNTDLDPYTGLLTDTDVKGVSLEPSWLSKLLELPLAWRVLTFLSPLLLVLLIWGLAALFSGGPASNVPATRTAEAVAIVGQTKEALQATSAASTAAAQTAVALDDDDGDGLSNGLEASLGTDPYNDDTDGDGLSDGAEVNTYGTNPMGVDTDGDTLSDGDEVAQGISPLNVDTDGDGINDNVDVEPGQLPTPVPTSTPTPTPSFTPTPRVGATIDAPSIISVKVTNLTDGQEVHPVQELVVSYSSLLPGWSIHVLLQPQTLSVQQMAVAYYPIEESLIVSEDSTSGEWRVEVPFGQGEELHVGEWYNLSLAVATSEQARTALDEAVGVGFAQFPDDVLSLLQGFSEVYYVFRGAYTAINEARLVYSAYWEEENRVELIATLPDGSDAQAIPNIDKIVILQPSLSPDGKRFAFVGKEKSDAGEFNLLWVMDADGGNRTLLLRQPGAIERPVWSPDGRYLAYSAVPPESETTTLNLFLYDISSGEFLQLTEGTPSDRYPSWMPDRQALVFNARTAATSTLGLFKIDIATGEFEMLYDTEAEESQPAVSPDGTKVAFVSSPDATARSNRDIYVLDLATGEAQRLTENEALDQYPNWHPDGRSVYFESYRTGFFTIWAVNVDGSGVRQITFGPSETAPFLGWLEVFLPAKNEVRR